MPRRAAGTVAVTPAAVAGAAAWLAVVVIASAAAADAVTLSDLLLVLSLLVIVPIGLDLVAGMANLSGRGRSWLSRAQLVWPLGALAAAASLALRPGVVAGALAIVFAAVAAITASAGLISLTWRTVRRLEAVLPATALVAPLAGAVWLAGDRLGWSPPPGGGGAAPALTAAHLLVGGFGYLLLAWLAISFLPLGRYQRIVVEASACVELAAAAVVAAGLGDHGAFGAYVAGGLTTALTAVAAVTCLVVARLRTPPATWPLVSASFCALAFAAILAVRDAAARSFGSATLAAEPMVARHGLVSAVGFVLLGLLGWSLARSALLERGGGSSHSSAR